VERQAAKHHTSSLGSWTGRLLYRRCCTAAGSTMRAPRVDGDWDFARGKRRGAAAPASFWSLGICSRLQSSQPRAAQSPPPARELSQYFRMETRAGCGPEGRRPTPTAPRRSQPDRRFGDAPKRAPLCRLQRGQAAAKFPAGWGDFSTAARLRSRSQGRTGSDNPVFAGSILASAPLASALHSVRRAPIRPGGPCAARRLDRSAAVRNPKPQGPGHEYPAAKHRWPRGAWPGE
jgi:hypothetical protein